MVADINMLPRGPKESLDRMSGIDRLAVGAFFAIALLIGIDLVNDSREGAAISHLFVELLAAITALSTGAFLVRHMSASYRKERAQLELRLAEVREESRKWREQASRHIHGLGAAIDAQFEAWGLSEAEKDVALLLLKGLSHKEIAALRETSERTVRQQAAVVYSKAGVDGRSGLAAFFLEDLAVSRSRKISEQAIT